MHFVTPLDGHAEIMYTPGPNGPGYGARKRRKPSWSLVSSVLPAAGVQDPSAAAVRNRVRGGVSLRASARSPALGERSSWAQGAPLPKGTLKKRMI